MSDMATLESMEQQLSALYQERERIAEHFGVCDADAVIEMVQSLERQVCDFYDRFGSNAGLDDAETAQMLAKIRELSGQLEPLFPARRVEFFMDNDRPKLRAEWSHTTDQGDQS